MRRLILNPHILALRPATLALTVALFSGSGCHRFIEQSIVLHPRAGATCSADQVEDDRTRALAALDEVSQRHQFKECDPVKPSTLRCYSLHPAKRSQGHVRIEAREKDGENISVRVFQWALHEPVSEYLDVKKELQEALSTCCSDCLKAEIYPR